MTVDRNALGERGELIVHVRLAAFHGAAPLFRSARLGDKWPVADFAVELIDRPGCFALVQAKSTRAGADARGRLPVTVGHGALAALTSAPVPTYIVGVDEPNEEAYIVAAHGPVEAGVSSVPTLHPLSDPGTRRSLRDDLMRFWAAVTTRCPWRASALSGLRGA